jgi:WD40 repeat protein
MEKNLPRDTVSASRLGILAALIMSATILWTSAEGQAQNRLSKLPVAPILQIESGQHSATIRRIDVDAANRFAVTASDDKTARVWSLPDGQLVRVFRLPIDQANIGKAYAVAISPDATTVAIGGWLGLATGQENIFLFDRASGKLLRRLKDLPSNILHLGYSPDGRRLVAALAGANGIRVYDVSANYHPLVSDTRYGGASYWAAFDHSGRLVTTSEDGFVRLYAANYYNSPSARFETPGHRPYSAAFSPDGDHIAVGYDDINHVVVLSGTDLNQRFGANTAGIPDVSLGAVGWSEDGQLLFAGGNWYEQDQYRVRRWSASGRGAYVDIPIGPNAISEILELKQNRMLFASTRDFGLIEGDTGAVQIQGLKALDLSSGPFRISENGDIVQVDSITPHHTYRFTLSRRLIDVDPPPDISLLNPAIDASGLSVTNWYNSRLVTNWNGASKPALNGTPLVLQPSEISRSLAVVHGANQFVLGTEWLLRLFDQNGRGIWPAQRVPSAVWHVNVTADGRLIVAAIGDGTIRWYRVSDGKEVLSLFIHPDGKRWIAWTPEGYYDATSGADELIGWHVNHGLDRPPDFYPVSQFRDRFYRTDVIKHVLYTPNLSVPDAVRKADSDAGLPMPQAAPVSSLLKPVVEIDDPKDPTREDRPGLRLAYSVRLPSAEDNLTLDAFVDGAKAPAEEHRLVNKGDTRAGILNLTIPRRNSVVSVIAYNRNGASTPALVHVEWAGAATEPKLTLYVLAIGISKYKDSTIGLDFPSKDADDFVKIAKAQAGGLYEKVILPPNYESLRDGDATKDAILDGLDWISRAVANTNDVAMVFLAGHGITTPDQHYGFLPYDYDADRVARTTIDDWELKKYLTKIAGKKLFFFDTCYSGNLLGARAADSRANMDKFANELRASENSIVVFASSTGNQFSLERNEWNNGAFTKALVEGMRGAAARPGLPVISLSDLDVYVSRRVNELTHGNQRPVMAKPATIGDYWIAQRLN